MINLEKLNSIKRGIQKEYNSEVLFDALYCYQTEALIAHMNKMDSSWSLEDIADEMLEASKRIGEQMSELKKIIYSKLDDILEERIEEEIGS